jgi:hypothetical protein
VTAPDLVYINPSVQVIADYDEPIFYSSNYYWRADGGVWYRSSNYTSGWVRVDAAPVAIRQIDHPSVYVHYHTPAVEAAARTSASARHDEHVEAHDRHDDDRNADHKEKKGH